MKRFLMLVSALSMSIIMASCGTPKTETETKTTTAESKTETETKTTDTEVEKVEEEKTETTEMVPEKDASLSIAHFADFRGKNEMVDYLKRFEEETGIKAVSEPITGDFADVMKTRIAANAAPDVFFNDIYVFQNFASADLLLPLDDKISPERISEFEPNLVNMFTYNGQIMGIPKDYNTLGLFYNKKMFDEAGVSYPTNEWSWDDLYKASNELKTFYGDKKYALVLQNELPRFQPLLESVGATFSEGKPVVNTDAVIKGLDMWTKLYSEGLATIPKDLGRDWDGDAFTGEDAAMTIEGNWMNSFIISSAPEMEYDVVELPSVDGKKANVVFTVAWSASKDTKYPIAAAKYIEWITSADLQREFLSDGGGAIPSNKELNSEFLSMYPNRKVFLDVAAYASPFDFGVVGEVTVKGFADLAENIRLDSATDVKAGLDTLQSDIDKQYDRLTK